MMGTVQGREDTREQEGTSEWKQAQEYVVDEELRVVDAEGRPFEAERASVRLFDAMGARVAAALDTLLTQRAGLVRVVLAGAAAVEHTTVYATPDLAARTAPLLVVVPGSGKVFNGVMSRRVCLGESLHTGSCWDDVRRAQALGWSVLVLNPNERPCRRVADARRTKKDSKKEDEEEDEEEAAVRAMYHMGKFYRKDGSPLVLDGCWAVDTDAWSPEEYARIVWERFVVPAQAKHIFVLAHSYGGALTCDVLASERDATVLARVAAVALADSVHLESVPPGAPKRAFFEDGTCIVNWARSPLPLDTPLGAWANGVTTRSAGTTEHAETTSRAHESIWKLFLSRLDAPLSSLP